MRSLVLLATLAVTSFGCFSENLEDRLNRGLDMLYEGRYEDAESHFLTLGRELARSDSPEARIWHAVALYRAGRVEHLYLDQPRRAVARLREALKLDPYARFAFDARREIAYIFYDRLRDYRTAALEFERLVNAFSDRKGIEDYHYRIAQCYFLLREFSQARTEARLLLEIQKEGPLAAETMLLVANSFYVEGRYQEAADAYQSLLAMHPGEEIESRSRFELGTCYQELGQFKLAERNLLLALKQHPRPDMVRMQLRALQGRMTEEKGGGELPYATAGRLPSAQPAQPVTAPKPKVQTGATPRPKEKPAAPKTPEKPQPTGTGEKKPPVKDKPAETSKKPAVSPSPDAAKPKKEKAESPKPKPSPKAQPKPAPPKKPEKSKEPKPKAPAAETEKPQ